MSLLDAAVAALAGAERRIEIAARNVANVNTPGYKREIAFAQIVGSPDRSPDLPALPEVRSARITAQAALVETGAGLDLAIDGNAMLVVRGGDRLFPTRGGSFRVASDGAVVDAEGRRLQQAGGGDLIVEPGDLAIYPDGAVFVDRVPNGTVALYAMDDEGDGTLPWTGIPAGALADYGISSDALLRQGSIERSNVVLSDEMIGLLQTQRMGEAAAQLIRVYDQLLSQATTTFGRNGR